MLEIFSSGLPGKVCEFFYTVDDEKHEVNIVSVYSQPFAMM